MKLKYPLIILIGTMLIFSNCKNESTVTKDSTLDIAIKKEPAALNPFLNHVASARVIYQNIFCAMADFHPDTYEMSPILIKELPTAETIEDGPYKGGTKYTVEILEEAKWEDGSQITGHDFVFSLKAIMHPNSNANSYKSYLKWISDVKVDPENDRRLTIYFKDYYILAKELVVTLEIYPKYFYDPTGAMDNISYTDLTGENAESLIKADKRLSTFAEEFNSVKYLREKISGAGPYKFKEWIPNQMIVLEKKENYWGENLGIPALENGPEEIIFHVISDETAIISQLKEGNIDFYPGMTATAFLDLKENEAYKNQFHFFTPELMRLYYIGINNSKPELSDPDVRRALAKMVDVPKLIEVIEKGMGVPSVGILNAKKSYYNDALKPITLDIAGAKNILAEEGWVDSNNDGSVDKVIDGEKIEMDLDIHITGSKLSESVALLMQQNAKEAGVKINIITKKHKLFKKENLKTRDYDLAPLLLSQDLYLDDPYLKWHSDNDNPSKSNDVSYRSEKTDNLIDLIRSTKDDDKRNEYYKELQSVMYEDQPVIFLYNPVEKVVLNKKWNGKPTMKRPGFLPNTFTN